MIIPTAPRTALVTGAAGVLGRQLVRYLTDRHWFVRALVRAASSPHGSGVVEIAGDLFDPDAVWRAVEGVDTVFHLAARREEGVTTARDLARVNVEGTFAIASAARRLGVRRVVYFGSTAVYGDTAAGMADERSVPHPRSEYARTKLEAESAVLQEAPGGVVLRLASVYGPHEMGNYLRLAALCGRGIRLSGGNRRTLVYEQDAMNAAVLAAEHESAARQIFNVTDGATHTLTAVTEAMAAALGARVHVTLPTGPVRAIAMFGCPLPRSFRPLVEDSAVDGRRMQRDLEFRPAVGLDSGWRLAIDAWRARGLL